MHRMAEEKKVIIDLSQDSDEDIEDVGPPNIVNPDKFCFYCQGWHPVFWECDDCDCHFIAWHMCCQCCRNDNGVEYLSGCEACKDEWMNRHRSEEVDSDAETIPYGSDDD